MIDSRMVELSPRCLYREPFSAGRLGEAAEVYRLWRKGMPEAAGGQSGVQVPGEGNARGRVPGFYYII